MEFIEILQGLFLGLILETPIFITLLVVWIGYLISTIKDKLYLRSLNKKYNIALEENRDLRLRLNIKGDFDTEVGIKEVSGEL